MRGNMRHVFLGHRAMARARSTEDQRRRLVCFLMPAGGVDPVNLGSQLNQPTEGAFAIRCGTADQNARHRASVIAPPPAIEALA